MRLVSLLTFLMLLPAASAQLPAKAPAQPVLVELFTSQSCSSCPPAEALFAKYAKRSDLVALEWHVDYWDSLQVSGAGRWKDPYSSSAWTERQRAYNRAIRGGDGIYTPQAVVGGNMEATGFDWGAIERMIGTAAKAPPKVTLAATRTTDIRFKATGAPKDAEALLVTFRLDAATDVKGGENKGRKLNSAHIVTGARRLGAGPAFSVPLPAQGEGCALLIQPKMPGPVLAAAYCP
ncbi:MAG TPA: DUF1223 domain-containing protein [Hyphomonadaceae bacterium]|jgi:hypothetical protein|nr:DUF1223 domain-containing protein [Hyphomonadaceae bacterium]